MGVSWEDSFIVGELIGLKTFFNEFVAYERLSELIRNRKAGGPEYVDNVKQYISVSLIHYSLSSRFAFHFLVQFPALYLSVSAILIATTTNTL